MTDRLRGILCFANINFQCPYCGIDYYDEDDRYLNRINRNKRLYTSVKCLCGQKFYVTYDIKGDLVAFKDSKQLPEIV